jgi:hypothetical protein
MPSILFVLVGFYKEKERTSLLQTKERPERQKGSWGGAYVGGHAKVKLGRVIYLSHPAERI